MGGGWNWLRIVSSGGFCISGVEPSGSAAKSYESAYNAVLPCVCTIYRSYRLLGEVCAARDLWGHSFTTMPQDAIVSSLLIRSRRY
jgi:hypothetical protein